MYESLKYIFLITNLKILNTMCNIIVVMKHILTILGSITVKTLHHIYHSTSLIDLSPTAET